MKNVEEINNKENIPYQFGTALKGTIWMEQEQLMEFLSKIDVEADFTPREVRDMAISFLKRLKESDENSREALITTIASQCGIPEGHHDNVMTGLHQLSEVKIEENEA